MKGRPPYWKIWLLAARPLTLTASWAPVVMGLAFAWGKCSHFDVLNAALTLAAATAIQVGTNFFNDFADGRMGADPIERLGPPRATALGWVSPREMLLATVFAFAVAVVCGVVLVYRSGTILLWIGLISIVCGVWYTAGRYSLAYLGLAEPFVLIFFGPVAVAGTVYAQCSIWFDEAFLLGLGPGALSTILLVLNNMRDRETDAAVGKNTLVVRFGKNFGLLQIFANLLIATAAPVLTGWLCKEEVRMELVLLPSIGTVVASQKLIHSAKCARGREFNKLMAYTSALIAIYCLLSLPAWMWF